MADQETKIVRLSKAAKEFNIGLSTIVEFLDKKGHKIDMSPNTKLSPELYDILVNEFQSDKERKVRSQQTSVGREQRTTISLKDTHKPKPEAEEETDEVVIKNIQNPDQDVVRARAERGIGVSVVGKIDLDKNKKKAPEPVKETEQAVEPVAEKPEVVEEKREVVETKAPEVTVETLPAKETVVEPEPPVVVPPKPEENQLVRAKAQTLTGPTVVGRITLPEPVQKKKPVASSGDGDFGHKKKRKRIKTAAVDVAKEAPSSGSGTGANRSQPAKSNKPQQKGRKPEVTEADIQKEIKDTLARLSGSGKSKGSKLRKAKREAYAQRSEEEERRMEEEKSILKLTEFVTVSELANMMRVSPTEVISVCMSLGIFVSINQRLDAETITIVADEFGYTVEFVSAEVQESIAVEVDDESQLIARPPIVTVMGHVDHGKTSLLDYIRKANVIAGEAGGITQHIGAYSVEVGDGKKITFLDTPGHEAFTAMRARGAQVTDLAIIVIAADDNVMPQTVEAINHAQAAGIPMIFAYNKIDKPGANPDKIREALSAMNILVEEWGGKYQSQEISAKQGLNIDKLLEKVLLEAELLDLKANPNKRALGTIIESSLDKGRGFVSTLLVEAGTLRVGDIMLAGCFSGRVKAMYNERGTAVTQAGPSTPVSLLGLNGAPNAGDRFNVMEDEKEARQIAAKRLQLQREQGVRSQKHITLDEIGRRIAIGDFKELNLIIKGDVDGSIEALSDSLQKQSTEKVQVNIIHKGVGQITESDVLLASASDAIIIGFQVRPSASARKLAEKEEIQIKLYSVIYAAIEEIKEAMEGLLSAKIEERIVGAAEIRETFKITKVGTIAGCFVTEGKILRNNRVRVIRDGIVIYTGTLGSLKRFKDDVKEVARGYECGLNIDRFNDVKEGDIVEAFEEIEVKQTLN
jgi:translation initiation factor IF-2